MKILSLAAGAAALALTAGPALAEKPAAKAAAAAAAPSQPIPYDQLDAHLKGAKQRAAKLHGSSEARTGVNTDTSAIVKPRSESSAKSLPGPESPPVDSPESGTVNPSTAPDTTNPPGVTPPDGAPRPR